MISKFARQKNDARQVRYTYSWLDYAGAQVVRVIMGYVGFGAGLYGTPLPDEAELTARQRMPRVVWWRTGASQGVEDAEQYANSGVLRQR